MFLAISSLCFTIYAVGHYFSSGINSGLLLISFLISAVLYGRFLAQDTDLQTSTPAAKTNTFKHVLLALTPTPSIIILLPYIVDKTSHGLLESLMTVLAIVVTPVCLGYTISKQNMFVIKMPNGDEI